METVVKQRSEQPIEGKVQRTCCADNASERVLKCAHQRIIRLHQDLQVGNGRLQNGVLSYIRQHRWKALAEEPEGSILGLWRRRRRHVRRRRCRLRWRRASATEPAFMFCEDLRARGHQSHALVVVALQDGVDEVVGQVQRARGIAGGVAHEHVRGGECGRERELPAGGTCAVRALRFGLDAEESQMGRGSGATYMHPCTIGSLGAMNVYGFSLNPPSPDCFPFVFVFVLLLFVVFGGASGAGIALGAGVDGLVVPSSSTTDDT